MSNDGSPLLQGNVTAATLVCCEKCHTWTSTVYDERCAMDDCGGSLVVFEIISTNTKESDTKATKDKRQVSGDKDDSSTS